MNYFVTNPNCNLDVYEIDNEDEWVECKKTINWASMIISIPILIIVLLIVIYYYNDYTFRVIIAAAIFYGSNALYYHYLLDRNARMEYRTAQAELRVRMDRGMSKAQAYESIQNERLKKAEMEQSARNAATQASGLYSIANSIRRT